MYMSYYLYHFVHGNELLFCITENFKINCKVSVLVCQVCSHLLPQSDVCNEVFLPGDLFFE